MTPAHKNGRFRAALRELARSMIVSELEACQGNRSIAARNLGMSRRSFYYQLEELGIDIPATHGNGYTAEKRTMDVTLAIPWADLTRNV